MISRRTSLALGLLALTPACAPFSLVNRDPPRLFHLTPKSTFDQPLPTVREDLLLVDTVTATAGLNTTRIAIKPTATTLEYYAGATWLEVVPVMTHNLVVESFDNSGVIDALPQGAISARAPHVLNINVREFQAEYVDRSHPPKIRVRLDARLSTLPRRETIATETFDITMQSPSADLAAVIGTFDQAFGSVVKDLIYWTADKLQPQT